MGIYKLLSNFSKLNIDKRGCQDRTKLNKNIDLTQKSPYNDWQFSPRKYRSKTEASHTLQEYQVDSKKATEKENIPTGNTFLKK